MGWFQWRVIGFMGVYDERTESPHGTVLSIFVFFSQSFPLPFSFFFPGSTSESIFSGFSGRCKDGCNQSNPAPPPFVHMPASESEEIKTQIATDRFCSDGLAFSPARRSPTTPIHCQCPRPTSPHFPLPAAMSLQSSCTSQQASQAY